MSEEAPATESDEAPGESAPDVTTTMLDKEPSEVSHNFLDSVDAEYRDDPNISKFESANDLAREHVNLQSLLGRKGVVLPTEDDSQDVWDKYRSEMGVPSNSSSYLADGEAEEGALPAHMAKVAHESNLSMDQFKKVMDGYSGWYDNAIEDASKDVLETTNENINSLRKEWGRAFEAKTDIGASALNSITNGKSESVANIQLADGTALGNNPEFIRVMASIGETMQEKGLLEGEAVNTSAVSPEEAKKKLSALMADPEKSAILFNSDFHPSKEELVKERERLLSFAYPEK